MRRLRARVADEPTGFVWVEKGMLAGSGLPASRGQVEWLAKSGIRSILTLTLEPFPSAWADGLGITLGHVPMQDHEPPSIRAMDEGVQFIMGQIEEKKPVAVHCLAGEGRTGCVLAAFLIKTKNLSADEALAALRKIKAGFVEWRQEKAVYDYASSAGRS